MDLEQVKQLRRRLTLHFSVLACLSAILVANNGSGSGSVFLPLLIFLVTASAYVLVDLLEVFHLGQIGSYVGMAVATLVALGTVVLVTAMRSNEATQLLSVAGLLIFPQCVLFFQKKNLRVFEQLAIFLLLQVIVAALINDNIIYGILLTPILLAWVSSLFLFARYASIAAITPGVDEPMPLLYELIYAKLKKNYSLGQTESAKFAVVQPVVDAAAICTPKRQWIVSAMLGIPALLFAGAMFYLLPRSGLGISFSGASTDRTGIPERISTGVVGRLLADPTPIFRLKLNKNGQSLKPDEPPYLRVDVFDRYEPPASTRAPGSWSRLSTLRARRELGLVPPIQNRDEVKVEIKVKVASNRHAAKILTSIPPLTEKSKELAYDRSLMVFEQIGPEHPWSTKKSFQYSFNSIGFEHNSLVQIYPDPRQNVSEELTRVPIELPIIGQKLDAVVTDSRANTPIEIAQAVESYFRDSGQFSYTLDAPPQVEITIDPLEDFVLNTKRGFCQHFATSMAAMLRMSKIPTRIVLGYRPTEWNNLGEFFQVRLSDAHVWVESRFSRDQLVGTKYEPWLTEADYYWITFDPTPYSEEARPLIQSQNRPLEYAEELWDDMLSRPSTVGVNNPYGSMAQAGQQELVSRVNRLFSTLRQWYGNLGFAWQFCVLFILTCGMPILIWQSMKLLPRLAPAWARRLGMFSSQDQIKQKFFARCVRMLESLGLTRNPDETLQEFTVRALTAIESKSPVSEDVRQSLGYLADLYHRLRFGRELTLPATEAESAERHLEKVAQAVRQARKAQL